MADEFMELMWENGQVLMRGRSTIASRVSYASHSAKEDQAKTRTTGDSNARYRHRPKSMISELDLNLMGLPGRKKLDDDYHNTEQFPGLYGNSDFNMFMLTSGNNTYVKHRTDAQVVPQSKEENLTTAEINASVMEIPHARNYCQLHESSLQNQRCYPSAPIGRSIVNASQTVSSMGVVLPNLNTNQLNSEPDRHLELRNLLIPEGDAQHQGGATRAADRPCSSRVDQDLKSNGDDQKKPPHEVATYKMDQLRPILEETPPDEQSEAPVLHRNANNPGSTSEGANTVKGKSINQGAAAATSICAPGASNAPSYYSLKRKTEDTDEPNMASPSESSEPTGSGAKRRRTAQVHNLSERKRRDKINKKMRALQALIPNSSKVDKASMLDKAIEYLKTLQLQLQIMSMRGGFCMPPMMVPTGMQHLHLANFPTMIDMAGLGMRMPMGIGSFSNPMGMFGGMAPMQVSQQAVPFIPNLIGGSSSSSTPLSATPTPFELLAPADPSLLSSKDALLLHNINSQMMINNTVDSNAHSSIQNENIIQTALEHQNIRFQQFSSENYLNKRQR